MADGADIPNSRTMVDELLDMVSGDLHQEALRRPPLAVEHEEVVEDLLVPFQGRWLAGGLDGIEEFLGGLHDRGGPDLPPDVATGELGLHLSEIALGEARLGRGDFRGLLDPFPVEGVLDPEEIPSLVQGSHGLNIRRPPLKVKGKCYKFVTIWAILCLNSRRSDSNRRPAVYETAALPLSYSGLSTTPDYRRGLRASSVLSSLRSLKP